MASNASKTLRPGVVSLQKQSYDWLVSKVMRAESGAKVSINERSVVIRRSVRGAISPRSCKS